MSDISIADLEKVFGPDASGNTPLERARTSRREFVRGQTMLAEASEDATVHRLTAAEALNNFGFSTVQTAIEQGQARLVRDRSEPAFTLRRHREALGYTQKHLAQLAKLSIEDVVRAETPGKISSIQVLERMAILLAIDERLLGFGNQTAGEEVAVRLRQLSRVDNILSPMIVSALAESAWVIARQKTLHAQINTQNSDILRRFAPDYDYGYPTYERGYALAAKTRQLLNLGTEAPIKSMRRMVSDTLGIPLVQTKLGRKLAGATIANGADRGIVVNIEGDNQSVWVRRMTLAHELGHLLWDPAERLNRLMVDRYSDLNVNSSARRDPVEMRANAFAIALLAPPAAVDRLVHQARDVPSAVFDVAQHFDISVTAAVAHIGNVSRIRVTLPANFHRPEPSEEVRAQEDSTLDYFPIQNVPPALVGRFAWAVARAVEDKLISTDTAAMLFRTDKDKINSETIRNIINITG